MTSPHPSLAEGCPRAVPPARSRRVDREGTQRFLFGHPIADADRAVQSLPLAADDRIVRVKGEAYAATRERHALADYIVRRANAEAEWHANDVYAPALDLIHKLIGFGRMVNR